VRAAEEEEQEMNTERIRDLLERALQEGQYSEDDFELESLAE
jgi:hypothetical protein